ncbi:thioesterase domain-containing protein, partial [Burkholderia sp. ABCPW 14]|uniref:thioesterase domain-containing protein n=1 Tax=Burkholderia sp. ABCPW 14 TaxID=1637860 RepID=UPI0012E3D2F2
STFTRRTPNGRPTIGVPIANTQAFVLSASAQLQPVGVPGELHLGGAGLARGYLGRPELTAERFVDNPIHDASVRRLYRTGDLVRWLPDGHLEFLGRLDQQVKIRGFRIELGEIDARLGACDGVREAAVVALDHAGESQLVAYVVPRDAHATSAPALRAALAAFLPAYMIPAAFVFLPALPLTPNGKLDRKRLPMPDDARKSSREYEPPRSRTETAIASVWQTLLDYSPVGRHDHFFEVGGHSLTALKLLDSLSKRFAVPLTAAMLFRSPSIEQLAREIDAARTGHDVEPPVERFRDGAVTVAPLLLVPPIGGSSLCYGDLVNALGYPGVVWGCQQTREIVAAETTGSAAGLAALYVRAWLERAKHTEVCLLGWSFGGVVGFEMASELEKRGVRVRWLGLIDTHLPAPGGDTLDRQALATFALDLGFDAEELAQWQHLVHDGESDALRFLWTNGRRTGRLPAAITLDELTERYRITAANLRRLADYRPSSTWQGPADYFLAARDGAATAARRSADVWRTRLPDIAVTEVDADHFSIVKSRHAQSIARLVTLKLEELIPA